MTDYFETPDFDDDEVFARWMAMDAYLEGGGDPDQYPDQKAMWRYWPSFMLHQGPHHCGVHAYGPLDSEEPSYCRKEKALAYLLRGGDPASFPDAEAVARVLPIAERTHRSREAR